MYPRGERRMRESDPNGLGAAKSFAKQESPAIENTRDADRMESSSVLCVCNFRMFLSSLIRFEAICTAPKSQGYSFESIAWLGIVTRATQDATAGSLRLEQDSLRAYDCEKSNDREILSCPILPSGQEV